MTDCPFSCLQDVLQCISFAFDWFNDSYNEEISLTSPSVLVEPFSLGVPSGASVGSTAICCTGATARGINDGFRILMPLAMGIATGVSIGMGIIMRGAAAGCAAAPTVGWVAGAPLGGGASRTWGWCSGCICGWGCDRITSRQVVQGHWGSCRRPMIRFIWNTRDRCN